ncbi:unnamed protein product [Rotaria sordida]|uniref:Novel STAND NTPase 3 domain-containing protein n=1 Tax=Rotaria sordida TaxID=392033 RepID=A0A818YM81_9BILA|nr:unnamed protein product [Rotaria sordida]
MNLPVESVYIHLQADHSTTLERDQARKLLLNNKEDDEKDVDAYDREMLMGLASAPIMESLIERDRFHKKKENDPSDFHDILRNNRWIVILGDPGSGKTTFVRWLVSKYIKDVLKRKEAVNKDESHMQMHGHDSTSSDDDSDDVVKKKSKTGNNNNNNMDESLVAGSTRMPILIRVGEFAQDLPKESDLPLIDYIGYHTWMGNRMIDFSAEQKKEKQRSQLKKLQQALHDYIKLGYALIVLDGLDEIPESEKRSRVVRLVEEFVDSYVPTPKHVTVLDSQFSDRELDIPFQAGGNQLIITSRIAGYHARPLNGQFSHYTILRMQIDHMKEFVDHWFQTVHQKMNEVLQLNISSEAIKQKCEVQTDAMKAQLEKFKDSGLGLMASNPCLLNFLCLIAFQTPEAELPAERICLYDRIAKMMVKLWSSKEGKGLSRHPNIVDRLICDIAIYIHQNFSSGLIEKTNLLTVCRKSLQPFYESKTSQNHWHKMFPDLEKRMAVGLLQLPPKLIKEWINQKTNNNDEEQDKIETKEDEIKIDPLYTQLLEHKSSDIRRAASSILATICPNVEELLKIFNNDTEYCYRSLMEAMIHPSDINTTKAHTKCVVALIKSKNDSGLLKLFVSELVESVNDVGSEIEPYPDWSETFSRINHIEIACDLADEMPAAFFTEIDQAGNRKVFQRLLIHTSRQHDYHQKNACIKLISIIGDLTIDVCNTFIDAVVENPSTQAVCYDSMKYFRKPRDFSKREQALQRLDLVLEQLKIDIDDEESPLFQLKSSLQELKSALIELRSPQKCLKYALTQLESILTQLRLDKQLKSNLKQLKSTLQDFEPIIKAWEPVLSQLAKRLKSKSLNKRWAAANFLERLVQCHIVSAFRVQELLRKTIEDAGSKEKLWLRTSDNVQSFYKSMGSLDQMLCKLLMRMLSIDQTSLELSAIQVKNRLLEDFEAMEMSAQLASCINIDEDPLESESESDFNEFSDIDDGKIESKQE